MGIATKSSPCGGFFTSIPRVIPFELVPGPIERRRDLSHDSSHFGDPITERLL
ncbi:MULTISPECIES: hypothetical protein [unclassified Lentimonas]|uniref:hypothetical protein n=1 Tax=unclassified Lentimonas TaxID=2630993 RepID=UPI001389C38B|nr:MULTISPECIES: hypothetical protein [unclassified Lentimonas]